jgi:hypothetical protein
LGEPSPPYEGHLKQPHQSVEGFKLMMPLHVRKCFTGG